MLQKVQVQERNFGAHPHLAQLSHTVAKQKIFELFSDIRDQKESHRFFHCFLSGLHMLLSAWIQGESSTSNHRDVGAVWLCLCMCICTVPKPTTSNCASADKVCRAWAWNGALTLVKQTGLWGSYMFRHGTDYLEWMYPKSEYLEILLMLHLHILLLISGQFFNKLNINCFFKATTYVCFGKLHIYPC